MWRWWLRRFRRNHARPARQRTERDDRRRERGRARHDPRQPEGLYLFRGDSGTKSTCFGACAAAWPPLQAAGKPTVGRGADAALLGTTTRSDGEQQVTYNGHPLYLYAGDENAGDTRGQGLTDYGAGWYVLSPAGQQVSGQSASSYGSGADGGGS
jgi:predicted lipoprotein with Yx(FWY)xxD motif